MLLGFDVDPQDDGGTLAATSAARSSWPPRPRRSSPRSTLLQVFADLAELSRNRPAGEEPRPRTGCTARASTSTPTCTASTSTGAACRTSFRARLARVLAHYGVTDLERSTELEEAVFRIFLAQQRSAPDVVLVTSLLQRWIAEPRPEAPLDESAHDLLDRLVLATQLRFPVVGDLARSVRFRWFDQPLVDAERAVVLAGVA